MFTDDSVDNEISSIILREEILKKEKWALYWISQYSKLDPTIYFTFSPINSAAIKFDIYNIIMAVYIKRKPKSLESYQPKPDYWHHMFKWKEAKINCGQGTIGLSIGSDVFEKWIEIFGIDVTIIPKIDSIIDSQYKTIEEANEKLYYANTLKLKFGGT